MKNQLKTQEKNKVTYTKEMIVKDIANECDKNKDTVRSIYNAIEEKVAKFLSLADPNTDITIRLFEGISFDSTFVSEKTKVNNLTGKVITSTSKIKPKANITRSYRDKITSYNK